MPTLDYLVNTARTRTPTATVKIGGRIWRGIISLKTSQAFGSGIATGTIVGRDPPVTPSIGTAVSWTWGYNGVEIAGFTGEIARPARKSYPNRYTIECRDVLWRADRSQQVIVTSPLNSITASAAVRYILTTYGGISSSRISLPTFSASGSEWVGSEWKLGILTPVQWGNTDDNSGGTTALKAAQEICSVLGYWLYADSAGIIRAKQMERAPSPSAVHTFRRGVDLLTNGSPELTEDVDAIRNRIIVKGANTGVDGAQIMDAFQTTHPLLPAGVYQEDTFSSFLVEYVNESQAGAASATAIAKRVLKVRSRAPIIVRHRTKADPHLSVGATVGIIDSAIGYTTAKNFFIYALETSADYTTGDFSQNHTLDGGTGNAGYTTIPPPDASFSWRLVAETLDADAVVEVFLDGSGSTSLTGGVIVSWAWSTSTTTYTGTPNTATGVTAVLMFLASEGTATITLTVTDTTSKTGTIEQTIDLTGVDTQPPLRRVLSAAFGAGWAVTADGAAWSTETTNGDAIAVGTIGGGVDDRAAAGSYGLIATRGAAGIALRQTLDNLATASTNLVAAGGAITSNIWVNESNPLRVWFAVGTALYRSIDGGATKTAMAVAPATIHWVMEDAAVDNSVFIAAGANLLNATDPTVGYAVLYPGPVGATARQFVRSRDGQVTWIAYTGAPAGESLQRVENGAAADWTATDCRTLALDNAASSFLATLTAITGDDPAQVWSFDGLTGLSAAQATPTLPAGATAMHMLADPDVAIYYIADFDSVVAGTGAVRKFLADQLFLYHAGATGQQCHMLGFGQAVSAPAILLMLPFNETGAADKLFIYDTAAGGWTSKALPESGKHWYSVRASPYDWRKLLLFRRPLDSDNNPADNALWYSADFGDTWTNVWTNVSNGTNYDWRNSFVEWSASVEGEWISSRINVLVRGSGATYTDISLGAGGNATAMPGLAGDAWFEKEDGTGAYANAANSITTTGATGNAFGWGDTLRGTTQAAHVSLGISPPYTISVTSDYRTGTWAAIPATGATHSVAVLIGGIVVGGNGANIDTVANAWTSPVITQTLFNVSDVISAASSDNQTQTVAVVLRNGANSGGSATCQPVVRDPDSGVWALIPRPADAGNLANVIEPIIKTT